MWTAYIYRQSQAFTTGSLKTKVVPILFLAHDLDRPSMVFNNFVGESHSKTNAFVLGGKERVEEVF